jgi:hypothetical protein
VDFLSEATGDSRRECLLERIQNELGSKLVRTGTFSDRDVEFKLAT